MGEEPPRGLNSFRRKAITVEPRTRPMISGRMYWTMPVPTSASKPARWKFRAPAMSRRKQAMQKPMLAGLPK